MVERRLARSKEEMGQIMRARRNELGLSVYQMNKLLGHSPVSGLISQIELGRRYIPVDRLRDYAEVLQMSVDDLVP